MMMRMRYAALVLSGFLALPAGVPASAGNSAHAKLRLIRVEAPALKNSDATQFLVVDGKGQPLLLRGDTLEVFRLGADGSFDRRVGKLACNLSSNPAYAAAFDAKGATWAVSSLREVALCDFEKEQHPAGLDWMISSLTYSRSGPLVAVTSLGPRADAAAVQLRKEDPRIFGLADNRWRPVSWAPISEAKALPANPMDVIVEGKAESDASICTGPKDAIWLAAWNSYRLQKLSASEKPEKPEREIVVGNGKLEWRKLDMKEQEVEKRTRTAQGSDPFLMYSVATTTPRGVVRALLCGRDGFLYLVVSTADGGLALDRFNPAQNLLDRVLLDGVTVSSGPMTAALGPGELWLGGRLAADGLWRISLDDLETAHWKPVEHVKIDGKPVG
jgi:hypothetical protein